MRDASPIFFGMSRMTSKGNPHRLVRHRAARKGLVRYQECTVRKFYVPSVSSFRLKSPAEKAMSLVGRHLSKILANMKGHHNMNIDCHTIFPRWA
jgi:hypothetical protein